MKALYLVAAVPLVVLVCLSAIAGYALGDLRMIPMQWNFKWTPTWYAPKWIGLAIAPVLYVIATASLIVARYGKTEKQQIREIVISGSIVVAGHLFYLYLLRNYLFTLAN